jgi:hypothetical protein
MNTTTTQRVIEDGETAEAEAVANATQLSAEDEPEDGSEAAEEMERMREARRSAMDQIGANLMGSLNEATQFRAQYEIEWSEDIRQFEQGHVEGVAASAPNKQDTSDEQYRSVTDNITRPATITFAARLGDMMFPTNDRNWNIDSTPKPELPEDVMASLQAGPGDGGDPPTETQLEQLVLATARKRMDAMRTQIDDQLSESRYNDHGREVIMSACKLGHGVMKGPFAQAKKRRRYEAGKGYKAVVEEVMTDPRATYVDPWLVYPLPCRRIEDCPGVFELHEMSKKRVADLRFQPGFSNEQLGRLLKQAPSWDSIHATQLSMRSVDDPNYITRNDVYAMFEYNGDMPQESLVTFVAQLLDESKMSEQQATEILADVDVNNTLHLHCNVWFCQGVVVKVAISAIDHQYPVYKFFVFEQRENSPFGKGVPRLLRDPQASVRMLWASIMLNSMMSSAPQIGVKKGSLVPVGPAAGPVDMRCTHPRVWAFNDDVEDIEKALQVFLTPNVTGPLLAVYERAKSNGQEQVMLPLIAQGEPTQSVTTSSGLAMLMNASNIVQRRLAARFDSHITTPIIQGFYDWNMEFGEDAAKGDYKVIARASSHLLVKDIQAQHFLTAMTLYSGNPELAPRMKMDAWAEEGLKIMDIDADRFLLSEEEFSAKQEAQAKNAPQDPETLKAQAAVKTADARALEAQSGAELAAGRLQLENQDRALDFEDRIADRESRERLAAMSVQQAMAGLDAEAQARVMEMQAELSKEAERNATQTRIEGMRIAAKAKSDQFEVQAEANTSPGPRLA